MNKNTIFVSILALIIVIGGGFYFMKMMQVSPVVGSFADCVAAGYPVMESYPRQCKTPGGQTFKEDIGNELSKDNLIRISSPRPNATVESPLKVSGVARGNWFFEASFPVKLVDSTGRVLAQVPAQAQGDWMTTDFVPFEVIVYFATTTPGTGQLILQKDNPSGLPENDDQLVVPVVFPKISVGSTTAASCRPSGCSGQICSDEQVVSNCEYRPEYACYKSIKCERQASGLCGWTETPTFRQCFENATKTPSLPTKLR